MEAHPASRTAVLVCQGRAAAHERISQGRFSDPTAMTMLREDERVPVEQVRAGTPPRGWAPRVAFEMVRASAEVTVPRTVAIDDALRARRSPQLVILGAGLDGRAHRMTELADVDVFEVDHPASQQDKRQRVGDLQVLARSLRYVPVDFTRNRLDSALAAAGHQHSVPTTWLWEGVVPYLSKADVAATVAVLAARSGPGSCLVVNYQTPALSAVIGRLAARAMTSLARQPSPWRSEPRRSSWTPNAMRHLLARHGYTVARDHDLLTMAEQLRLPVRQRRSLHNGRIATANLSSPSEPDRR
jgi:methyltransferase (TIGR00027 family)